MPQPEIDSILVTLAPTVSVVYAKGGTVVNRDESPLALTWMLAVLRQRIATLEAR